MSQITAARNAGGDYALIIGSGSWAGAVVYDAAHSINQTGVFVLRSAYSTFDPPFRIPVGATLDLPAGTVLKLDGRGSTAPRPGDWQKIAFFTGDDTSSFSHTEIRYGGGVRSGTGSTFSVSGGGLRASDLVLTDGAGHGIAVSSMGPGTFRLDRITIRDHAGLGLSQVWWRLLANSADISLVNNAGGSHVTVASEMVSDICDLTPASVPGVLVTFARTVIRDGRLTLPPGTIIKGAGYHSGFATERGGDLHLRGTGDAPIWITSLHDDSIGGDTNGDSSVTLPAVGDWHNVQVANTTGTSRLEHVVLRYSGWGGTAGFEALDGGAILRHLRVEHGRSGFHVGNLYADLDNAVVYRAVTAGIRAVDGAFAIRHATVVGCGGEGIVRTWTGNTSVFRNSIVHGNTGGNVVGFAAGEVFHTNGAFAAQNGNVDVPPGFVDEPNGDLNLVV